MKFFKKLKCKSDFILEMEGVITCGAYYNLIILLTILTFIVKVKGLISS